VLVLPISLDARHEFLRKHGITEKWEAKQLGDLAKVVGGGTPSRDENRFWTGGQIPWATPTDLTNSQIKYINKTAERITELGVASSAATLLPVGSVLYTSRATIGAKAIAAVPICTNQGFVNFLVDGANSEYLYYLLELLTPIIKRLAAGTTFDEVSKRDIRTVWCSVPSDQKERDAIISILSAVDAVLECTRAASDRARSLDHSLLHSLLEQGINPTRAATGKYPSHWNLRRVDEVADVGSGITLGNDVSSFKSIELPYLRVANVQDGHLDLSTIKTVRVRFDEVDAYRLEVGDVLMTEGGDLDKLGRGTIWEGQIENCLHQNHIFRIRANRDLLEPEFFSFVVESDIAKRYFNRVAKQTTNLASTNKTQVRAFQFPVPPTTAEQRQIISIMKASKQTIAGLLLKEAALARLKKSLLHDLLTGRLRVQCELQAVAS
jgi:type I restriction enzyme, S subunit